MAGFDDEEIINIVVPTMTNDGREVKAARRGKITTLMRSNAEQRQSGVCEINLIDERYDGSWPLMRLPTAYFERASEVRRPGELRQGDRVRLRSAMGSYEAGDVCTVLVTRTQSDAIFYDVIPDFGKALTGIPREHLEEIPGDFAKVVYAINGKSVSISFENTKFDYGDAD